MKLAFIILASTCLAQFQSLAHAHSIVVRQAFNPVQAAIERAMTTVRSLDKIMLKVLNDANALIDKYHDNTTNYATEYRISSSVQIKDLVVIALNATSKTMTPVNINVTACLDLQRNNTKDMGRIAMEDVGRCVGTKLKEARGIGSKLTILANNTANFVPDTNAKIKLCDREPNEFFKYGCIGRTSADASAKAADLLINLSLSMGTATAFYSTFQEDLEYCTQARILAFRRKLADIPLTLAICTARAVMA